MKKAKWWAWVLAGVGVGVMGCSGAAQGAADAYEPDNTPAAARRISNGQTQRRTIHRAGDVDFAQFRVPDPGGRSVVIETAGARGDTQMWLYKANRTLVAYNDNGGTGNFSRIRVAALSAGTYLIKVREQGNNGTIPAYTLRLKFNLARQYMVVDLSAGPRATRYPVSYLDAIPAGGWTETHRTTKMVLRRIAKGSFRMGSPSGELGREGNEVLHRVTLTKDYYIGVFEVTQKQWERVMGTWPSYYHNPACRNSRPVQGVMYRDIRGARLGAGWPTNSRVDASSFMGRLRARTGHAFDLPTEAQWEYVCRAGKSTALNSGRNLSGLDEDASMNQVGRYVHNGGGAGGGEDSDTREGTARVGSYRANAWGLYDMHGNVYEWCLDWFGEYGASAVVDPRGEGWYVTRVIRGGSYAENARHCRSAYRISEYPAPQPGNFYDTLGLRVARTLP